MTATWIARLSALIATVALGSACAMPENSAPGAAAPTAPASNPGVDRTEVLLFTGASAWMAEVNSLESILYSRGITYEEADSPRLDGMSLDQLSRYTLLIIPGGDAPSMTRSLSQDTHARLRQSVQERGLGYLGFCAGAWLAVAPAPEPGHDVVYGIGFVDGPVQKPSPLAKDGRPYAITKGSFPDGTKRDLLWYGGPTTPDRPGGVVARYPDGTPAITQIPSGKGFVVISGLHPAATAPILSDLGLPNREAIAPDFAWKLIEAASRHAPLPAF